MKLRLQLAKDGRMIELWLDTCLLCVVHIDDLVLTIAERDLLLSGEAVAADLKLKDGM